MRRQEQTPLSWLACLLALWVVGVAPTSQRGVAAENRPLPFLMAEDFEDLDFCAWRIEPGKPDSHNPLLEPAMPWDTGSVFAHGTVLRDPIGGRGKARKPPLPAPAGKPDKVWPRRE